MTIRLFGHDVEVRLVTSSHPMDGAFGMVDYRNSLIYISEHQTLPQRASTLLHEIIHYISRTLYLNLTEEQVYGIEAGLFQLLNDNPNLFKFEFDDSEELPPEMSEIIP